MSKRLQILRSELVPNEFPEMVDDFIQDIQLYIFKIFHNIQEGDPFLSTVPLPSQ